MANEILFVFEGARTEEKIVQSMQRVFMEANTVVTCVFGAEIYQLYDKIEADEDLDTFNLIKERNLRQNEFLKDYNREDFAEIYLFFDYDGHASKASDEKLKKLLDLFDEETDKGKLFVSYPMVEALRHIVDNEAFRDLLVPCKENINYKRLVGDESANRFKKLNQYSADIWHELVHAHLRKANFIVYDEYELPNSLIFQNSIFLNQLEKFISQSGTVAVLSAFPMFLHDYFGNENLLERIES